MLLPINGTLPAPLLPFSACLYSSLFVLRVPKGALFFFSARKVAHSPGLDIGLWNKTYMNIYSFIRLVLFFALIYLT